MADERLLQRVQFFTRREPLDRHDGRTAHLQKRHEAAVHEPAIDDDTAGAAFPFATSLFRARQVQRPAQNIEQSRHRMPLQ
jgi:hypothetical protein